MLIRAMSNIKIQGIILKDVLKDGLYVFPQFSASSVYSANMAATNYLPYLDI